MSEYLTVTEVATTLRVSKMTVYRMIHAGSIESVSVGQRAFRISEEALAAYLERQTTR